MLFAVSESTAGTVVRLSRERTLKHVPLSESTARQGGQSSEDPKKKLLTLLKSHVIIKSREEKP
jgi:hypothetical protein